MSGEGTSVSPEWLQYEAGRPTGVEATINLLVVEVVRLKHLVDLLFSPGNSDEKQGGDGGGQGGGNKPTPPKDAAEPPDTEASIDATNFKAKIRAIRTDANGNYQGTTLEAVDAITNPNIAKGGLFRLRNKNWENEFKRAQSAGKQVCLRISDGKVQAIEVLD